MFVRGPDDLFAPLHTNGGGLLAAGLPGMTVDSDAKKAKLDTSLTLVPTGMVLPQAQQHILSAVALANNQFLTNPPIISQAASLAGVPAMAASTSTASLNGQRPSKVVHLRNIPSDMTELELLHFCMPYGKLVNYLMLKGKNQVNFILKCFLFFFFSNCYNYFFPLQAFHYLLCGNCSLNTGYCWKKTFQQLMKELLLIKRGL
uniref:RRM domain-containing protein n=1 Tax=Ascaris lumbricoides TaxID=6252 RepID=A0A0M3IEP8_ASCLU